MSPIAMTDEQVVPVFTVRIWNSQQELEQEIAERMKVLEIQWAEIEDRRKFDPQILDLWITI
jgi:hypothetical protein